MSGIFEFKIVSLEEIKLFPTKNLFVFTELKVVCPEVRVWLKLNSIQSIWGHSELHILCRRMEYL